MFWFRQSGALNARMPNKRATGIYFTLDQRGFDCPSVLYRPQGQMVDMRVGTRQRRSPA